MTKEGETNIDYELKQVPAEELPPKEIDESDQYRVEYVQCYAGLNDAGEWEVHIAVVWDGDPNEIILDAGDAKALSGGIAVANSYIMKERTKAKFTRKKPQKSD